MKQAEIEEPLIDITEVDSFTLIPDLLPLLNKILLFPLSFCILFCILFSLPSDSLQDKPVDKNVFIIFCQGEQLRAKIRKLCESFGAKLYPCPETPETRRELLHQVEQRISDLNNVSPSYRF